jgi:hypothetical protein
MRANGGFGNAAVVADSRSGAAIACSGRVDPELW